MSTSLPALFEPTFRDHATDVALEWACHEYTFRDIDARADRMAAALAARGLRAGDRLAIQLANRIDYIDVFLAATRLGVILVPINILYREQETAHILGDASPQALVTASSDAATPGSVERWQVDELAADAAVQRVDAVPHPRLDPSTPAAIVYTSGTTGAAKGAVITHGALAANARTLVDAWRITSRDRFLLALPLFHVHGLGNGLHCWLHSGCRTRLLERFDHRSAPATLLDFQPSLFFGVPTMYVRLLEIDRAAARTIGETLRLCVSGSAPLAAQVLEDFEARFGQRILERYGMTETLMTLGNPYDGERRAGTVGVPFRDVKARVVDDADRDVADGVAGELLVTSPSLFTGYWKRPEATAAAFRGEWFATGDIAARSPDGYFTLCGRKSDLIISGGFNIYPREIEEVLAQLPLVAEVAVAGREDRLKGEVPVAFVVAAPGAPKDGDALLEHCRSRLASFKVPRDVQFVDALPRNAMGKVEKKKLM